VVIKEARQFNRECEVKQTTLSDQPGSTELIISEIHKLLESDELKLKSHSDLLSYFFTQQSSQYPLEKVNYQFKDNRYYLRAMTHTSFVHEFKSLQLESNEKLEFLGDSILGTLVSTLLINQFPKLNEGQLSKFRSSLVNGTSFAELGQFIGIGQCLLLGKGEFQSKGNYKEAILADGFEAFMGAIYTDSGFVAVKNAFYALLENYKIAFNEEFINEQRLLQFDAKSRLQEKTMSLYKSLPEYKTTILSDHLFHIEVLIEGKVIASMEHISKKKAERELAAKIINEDKYIINN
jgi:ribonuclease III